MCVCVCVCLCVCWGCWFICVNSIISSFAGKKSLKKVDYKYDVRDYNHADLTQNWATLNVFGAIPKIPMPPSLMWVKNLFQEDFEDICEYGEAYCDISDPVFGLLAWRVNDNSFICSTTTESCVLSWCHRVE